MAMITMIKKRDGRQVPFNIEKIANAIFKAAQTVGGNVWLSVVFSLSERMFPNLFPLQMVTARTRKKQVIRLMMTWAFNVFIFSCYL